MTADFQNKVVMVTGATGGLGQNMVRRFAAEGARVVLVGRELDKLNALAAELGGNHIGLNIDDLADPDAVDSFVKSLESQDIKVDVLIHTVGGFAAGKPVHEAGIDVWENQMRMNARPIYVTCGRIARHMIENQVKGRIVAIVAKSAFKGGKNMAAYSASKAAAQRVLESMAVELVDHAITVNAIAPSTIDTPANRKDMPNADFSRWVTVEQIADACVFLASNPALNGTTLEMYGRT